MRIISFLKKNLYNIFIITPFLRCLSGCFLLEHLPLPLAFVELNPNEQLHEKGIKIDRHIPFVILDRRTKDLYHLFANFSFQSDTCLTIDNSSLGVLQGLQELKHNIYFYQTEDSLSDIPLTGKIYNASLDVSILNDVPMDTISFFLYPRELKDSIKILTVLPQDMIVSYLDYIILNKKDLVVDSDSIEVFLLQNKTTWYPKPTIFVVLWRCKGKDIKIDNSKITFLSRENQKVSIQQRHPYASLYDLCNRENYKGQTIISIKEKGGKQTLEIPPLYILPGDYIIKDGETIAITDTIEIYNPQKDRL